MNIFLFALGFTLVIFGAEKLIDSAQGIAEYLKVPHRIIGLTLVAFGTSLPEFVVSTMATVEGNYSIALGNVVGSNIFNIGIVLGVSLLFCTASRFYMRDITAFALSAFLLCFFMLTSEEILPIMGLLFLIMFAWYIRDLNKDFHTYQEEHKEGSIQNHDAIDLTRCIFFALLGLSALVGGGYLIVNAAESVAVKLGMTNSIIALTIIAAGTSIPELAASIVAARKNDVDLAVGNVVGSNIFNILFILGLDAIISPLNTTAIKLVDIIFLAVLSATLTGLGILNVKLGKICGGILIGTIIIYYLILML